MAYNIPDKEFAAVDNKKIVQYQFYRREPNGEDQYIGSLTERRKSQMGNKDIFAYQFYRRERSGKDQCIGSLIEKRKKAERITHFSVMNWAKLQAPKDVFEDRVYFVRVEI